jgi:hypothetical protein
VLFDIVPHGGSYVSRERHPNWICRDEDGKPIDWFGAGCDYAAAGYQRDIQDICEYNVRQLGLDGFRIDCAMGGPANWSTEAKRVSQSTLAGALGMNAAIRRGFELARPGDSPLLYPEEWSGNPAFSPHIDIEYGGPMYWMLDTLRKANVDAPRWGPQIQGWLSDEFWGTPPGSLRGRFITNHDMDRDNGPVSLGWGMARSRALMALCFGIDGAPFLYEEQEVGSGPFYAHLAAARRAIPELRRGAPDYDSASGDGLFCCVRHGELGDTLVLVNLTPNAGPREVTGASVVRLRPEQGQLLALDALSGEMLPDVAAGPARFNVDMPAFGARYIVFRRDAKSVDALRHQLGWDVPQAAPQAAGVALAPAADGYAVSAPLAADLRVTCTTAQGEKVSHATLADGKLGEVAEGALSARADGEDTLVTLTLTPARDLNSRGGTSVEVALTAADIARWFAVAGDCLWEDWQEDRHFNWSDGGGYGYGPGIMHQGRLLADRLYESGVWPLHSAQPWVALSGHDGGLLGARVEAVEGLPAGFPAPNLYYSDGSSPNLALREPGWRLALVDRYYPGHPARGPQVVGADAPPPTWRAGTPVTVTLRLRGARLAGGPATQPQRGQVLSALTGSPELTWDNPLANAQVTLPGSTETVSRGMASMTWGAFQTMKLGWRVPLERPGVRDIWVRIRNSEVAARGTDLCGRYQFTLDGEAVEAQWRALGTERVGDNGYIGWLSLPVPAEAGPSVELWMETTANWCAVDEKFILSADPAWAPDAVAKYQSETKDPGAQP